MIDRRFVFAATALALLTACTSRVPPRSAPVAPAVVSTASVTAAAPSSDTPHPLLLISIDGLRADMLDRGITPNLSQLAHDGVR
ncbi:alkaline phosphatase family protein, partial [Xanthomonas hortorum]